MNRYASPTPAGSWRDVAIVGQLLERIVELETENLALREALCRAEFDAMSGVRELSG